MARPGIWAGHEARGGSIPAVGLRPTNNNVAGTKIGRSDSLPAPSVFHLDSLFLNTNAAAGIYEMASRTRGGRWTARIRALNPNWLKAGRTRGEPRACRWCSGKRCPEPD